MRLARSSSRKRVALRRRPPRLIKYWIIRIADPSPRSRVSCSGAGWNAQRKDRTDAFCRCDFELTSHRLDAIVHDGKTEPQPFNRRLTLPRLDHASKTLKDQT